MSRLVTQSLTAAVLSVTLLLLTGCPYESALPLSTPGEAPVDSEILGTWKVAGSQDDGQGTVTVSRFSDHEVLIVIEEKAGSRRELFRAFTTHVGKERFLNIQGIEGPYDGRKWMYLNYSAAEGLLTYRVVSDSLLKDKAAKASSSKDLYEFLLENLSNKDLYDRDQTSLRRVGTR